jgi:hypothetical protein
MREGWNMRVYLTALGLAISVGCVTAAPNAALSEEYRGTLEQQLACTPDVFRLCGE